MHLAPTASRRIYQQRVGRVTRRAPGKEAGLVIDFVHPATTHDETIVTLHSLLDREVYRGGAIVVGPVRRSRGRRVRVERRIVPVSDVEESRMQVLEREIWRIAVENLDYPEQHAWAALAGARVNPQGWRRARAMLQGERTKELRRRFLLTCVQRNRNSQLRLKALTEIADLRDPEAFDDAIEIVGTWSRDDKRAGTKTLLQALVDKRIGRRDQAQAWVWRLASYTRELHEEYAVQRWPETKRLLGLLVNSSGRAHGRNARRLVHAARKQDRRLAVSLLAAAVSHTPGGGRGAARRADADGAETVGDRPRAAAQLPQRRQTAPQAQQPQAQGQGENGRPRRQANGSRNGEVEAADAMTGVEADEAQRRRWTSPAPRATRSPPAVTTTRLPRSSTPSATPEPPPAIAPRRPPSQAISRALAARRAPRHAVEDRRLASASTQRSRAASSAPAAHPPAPRAPKSEVAVSRSSGGNSSGAIVRFRPTPITAQPSWGRASIRMPASLRPSSQTSLGHLIAHSSPGCSDSAASQTASGTASGSSRWRSSRGAQDRRVEQRLARRRGPGCGPGARVPRSARRR